MRVSTCPGYLCAGHREHNNGAAPDWAIEIGATTQITFLAPLPIARRCLNRPSRDWSKTERPSQGENALSMSEQRFAMR
jgi:hypothetical protein